MKKLFTLLLVLLSFKSYSGWNLVTGLTDNYNSVYFNGSSDGYLAGDKGTYYTTTGGTTSGSWIRLSALAGDSIVYNHTQFTGIAYYSNTIYFCGNDTVANRAVIFKANTFQYTCSLEYSGQVGSRLNSIAMDYNNYYVIAVGDNGLIVFSIASLVPFDAVPSNTTSNLHDVSFIYPNFGIAGDGILIKAHVDTTALVTENFSYPGETFRAIGPPYSFITGGQNLYELNQDFTLDTITEYNHGPINPKSISGNNHNGMIATDHGVYKYYDNMRLLEYQPTSSSYNLNDVHLLYGGYSAFACGDNGILIYTTDAGEPNFPHCNFNPEGTCVTNTYYIYPIYGTGTSFQWLLDGVAISTSSTFNHLFTSTGYYTITFIVTNAAGYSDTAEHQIYIADPPTINLPVTLGDTLLCKGERVNISINNTLADYNYYVANSSYEMFGFGAGGGNISFFSDTVTETGNYHIRVRSAYAECALDFQTNFNISVEHTASSFRCMYVNQQSGKPVDFDATSIDANHFIWTFSNATPSTSNLHSPTGINFSNAGTSTVSLISYSDNACYDTTTGTGPMIYTPPSRPDTCFAFNNEGVDVPWAGHYTPDINSGISTGDGFLVCGSTNLTEFHSRYGNSIHSEFGSGYLAKYTINGVLEWVVSLVDSMYGVGNFTVPIISNVSLDDSGNIYMVGISESHPTFIDNAGKKSKLINASSRGSFIVKLTHDGKFIWNRYITLGYANKIKVAPDGNIIALGGTEPTYAATYYEDTMHIQLTPGGWGNLHQFILKLSPAGSLIWHLQNEVDVINDVEGLTDFSFDASSSIYMTGSFGYLYTIYSAGDSLPDDTLNSHLTGGSGLTAKCFILKYSSSGQYQWKTYAYGTDYISSSESSKFLNIETDPAGYSYLSGYNGVLELYGDTFKVYSPTGALTNYYIGGYMLMKLDPAGNPVWISGTKNIRGSAYGLELHGNEITTFGNIFSDTLQLWTGQLYESNGNTYDFDLHSGALFILRYDTSGIIDFATKTGYSTSYDLWTEPYGSIFRDSLDHIYIATVFNHPMTTNWAHVMNDSLFTDQYDGVIIKMGLRPCNLNIGIDEMQRELGITVYPNPTTGDIKIDIDESIFNGKLTLRNIVGETIYQETFNGKAGYLNISGFSSGIYLLTISTEKFNRTIKIIRQ